MTSYVYKYEGFADFILYKLFASDKVLTNHGSNLSTQIRRFTQVIFLYLLTFDSKKQSMTISNDFRQCISYLNYNRWTPFDTMRHLHYQSRFPFSSYILYSKIPMCLTIFHALFDDDNACFSIQAIQPVIFNQYSHQSHWAIVTPKFTF